MECNFYLDVDRPITEGEGEGKLISGSLCFFKVYQSNDSFSHKLVFLYTQSLIDCRSCSPVLFSSSVKPLDQ